MKQLLIAAFSLNLSIALLSQGQIIWWGSSIAAEVTKPPAMFSLGIVQVSNQTLLRPTALTAGETHGLLLQEDGTVFGWGADFCGQATGTPHPYNTNGPVFLAGKKMENVKAIAAGENFSAALKYDGKVETWGLFPTSINVSNVNAISAGSGHILVAQREGFVKCFGDGNPPPPGLSNVVAVSATGTFYGDDLALKRDGTVAAWPTPAPSGLTNVVAISAGWNHNLALTKDGRVYGWGFNGCGGATGIENTNAPYISSGFVTIAGKVLSNVVAIAAADEYSLALKIDGSVVVWGKPSRRVGEWKVPAGLSNVVAIAAGPTFCLAVTTNAAVAERFRR